MSHEPTATSAPRKEAGAAPLTITQGLALAGVAAGATIVMVLSVSDERQIELLALILAVIASVYVGVALAQESPAALGIEIAFALAIGALVVLGLWASPYWLAAGYFAHGVWDLAHHRATPALPGVALPRWYAPSCLVYDWVIGILVLAVA
jgi:hypothetical protein